jgi:hypothetical protein
MTPEQVAKDRDEQPEPYDEEENRENIARKLRKVKPSAKSVAILLLYLAAQGGPVQIRWKTSAPRILVT